MKKVIIIGAGISGLFFANLLKQDSEYEITIYEKNNSINLEKGYGIQLSVNSINLLNKIGFQNISSQNKFNPNKVDFYSLKNKNKICDLDISSFNTDTAKFTTLQRVSLIEFLKDKLPSNFMQYNKKINKIDFHNHLIHLSFEDKSYDECDFLIICDGVFSTSKSLILKKDIKPKYFNSVAIRANINKTFFKDINYSNISLFLGHNLHYVVYPLNQNSEFNFIGVLRKKIDKNLLDNYSLFNDKESIKSIISDLSGQIDQNILTNLKDIKCFPIFVSKNLESFKQKNIFLLGDAFFTFPPTFAQGASHSIEIAHELYTTLKKDTNEVKDHRIKRIKMIDRRSKFNFFLFHLSNPFLIFIRDLTMKYLLKNKKFIQIYLGKIYKN